MIAYLSCDERGNIARTENEHAPLLEGKCSCKNEKQTKNILFMGQAGSGKKSMINLFANHVLGIEIQDEFRYEIITKDHKTLRPYDVMVYHIKTTDIKRG